VDDVASGEGVLGDAARRFLGMSSVGGAGSVAASAEGAFLEEERRFFCGSVLVSAEWGEVSMGVVVLAVSSFFLDIALSVYHPKKSAT